METPYSHLTDEQLLEEIRKASGGLDPLRLIEAFREMPKSEQERAEMMGRGILCREISEQGYKNLYWMLTKREFPAAHMPLLLGLLRAYKEQRGVMVQAWRGFGKSTDLLVWVLLLLGNNPVGSMSFIRINDTKAQESGDAVASIVEDSFAWKCAFPNVVPDPKQGWSKKAGFHVKDTNVCGQNDENYSTWREKCFADHTSEASLICAGIESGMLIGLHSTNGSWFDDLHDELNTRSMTEMRKVVSVFEGNILPTWTDPKRPMMTAVVCTPWDSDNDVYHAMLETGLLELVKIPIFEFDEEGVEFAPLGRKVRLTWPEVYTVEAISSIYKSQKMNPKRFWQMFLLDDKAARANAVYKYYSVTKDMVRWDYPLDAGIDPVYTDRKDGAVSHFAMLYGLRMPGYVVVAGGVLEKCSASQGMMYVVQAQRMFPTFGRAWCETYGGGILFIQMVQQNPGIRINPIEPKELGRGNKGDRQYSFLEPLLSSGYFVISDEDAPVLNTLRNYLDLYPNIPDEHAPEWDVADALVALLYGYFRERALAVNSANDAQTNRLLERQFSYNRLAAPPIQWNEWKG